MIINGVKLAAERETALAEKVRQLKQQGVEPCLAVLVFPGDSSGQLYCRLKAAAAARLGIRFIKSETDLIEEWNHNPAVHGIMVQRPAYRGEEFEKEWEKLVKTIALGKDVDGLRADSLFVPATIKAVESILLSLNIPSRDGMLIVGRGMIGRALVKRLKAKGISSRADSLINQTKQADILICCSGREKIIKSQMVKPGAVVIDVGWPKGDVDFDTVVKVAGAITPVPG
ncbi:hypothetical protein L6272_03120, partial [Microgenomates group bacterium]|nr:hypothetical protein [Microgenomates group bacterium]